MGLYRVGVNVELIDEQHALAPRVRVIAHVGVLGDARAARIVKAQPHAVWIQ